MSFAEAEYQAKKRVTRRERFLNEMERVVPWPRLVKALEPYYPKGERGRPPIGLERMLRLRLYFLQQWPHLADEALEDMLYDSAALRGFAGIDLSREAVPDATTLMKFRHLLEKHESCRTAQSRGFCLDGAIQNRIARKGIECNDRLGRHRWVVERTHAWLAALGKLRIRFERRIDIHLALLSLACSVICSPEARSSE